MICVGDMVRERHGDRRIGRVVRIVPAPKEGFRAGESAELEVRWGTAEFHGAYCTEADVELVEGTNDGPA